MRGAARAAASAGSPPRGSARRRARRRRRKTNGAITRSTGLPAGEGLARRRGPEPARRPRARSMPVSSRVSRTAVASRSRRRARCRPPGNPMCPDQGSFSCSARRMNSSSRPPARRVAEARAPPPRAARPSATAHGRVAAEGAREVFPAGHGAGPRARAARSRVGQPQVGHVGRELAREQQPVDLGRRRVAQARDLVRLRSEAVERDVGAAEVAGHVVDHVADSRAARREPHVAQVELERLAAEDDLPARGRPSARRRAEAPPRRAPAAPAARPRPRRAPRPPRAPRPRRTPRPRRRGRPPSCPSGRRSPCPPGAAAAAPRRSRSRAARSPRPPRAPSASPRRAARRPPGGPPRRRR